MLKHRVFEVEQFVYWGLLLEADRVYDSESISMSDCMAADLEEELFSDATHELVEYLNSLEPYEVALVIFLHSEVKGLDVVMG